MLKDQRELNQRVICYVIVVLIAVMVAGILVMAWVPPVSRDALTHHLAVPKLYLEKGGIVEIPDCPFSYYPMNLDLLYMLPLYWGNDILPKYIHFSFALLTALLIFAHLRRNSGTVYGLLGSLLFISIPVVVKLSITVYVDLGLIFFSTAALLYLLKWGAEDFTRRNLLLSAVFCGLAIGTKYNGLITFFLLTLFVPVIYLRDRSRAGSQLRAAGYGVIFFVTALVVFSPWMIRNMIWKGNPVYPLYHNLFTASADKSSAAPAAPPPGIPPEDKTKKRGPLGHFTYRWIAFGESGWEIALIPLRLFFQGRDDTPKYFDGVLNPYLLILPLFAFIFIRSNPAGLRREKAVLGAFSILYLLFVFFREDMRARWVGPILPPLVILSVYGVKEFLQFVGGYRGGYWENTGKLAAGLGLGALLVLNFSYMANLYAKVAPIEYIAGKVSRADYISRYRPAYKVHDYAAHHLRHDSIILGQFLGNRRYYSRRQIVLDDALIKRLIDRHKSEHAVVAALSARGITHLMVRHDLFEKWVLDNFDPSELSILKAFFSNHLTPLYTNAGYVLYKLF
jgi:hypothetical protein